MQKGDKKEMALGLLLSLALILTAYMVISSTTTSKPVWASTRTGRDYPAPAKATAKPAEPSKNSIEFLLGDETARLQLRLEIMRLQAVVDKRRAEETAKRLQSKAPVSKDFPETEAMETLLLAEDYSGVHWQTLNATHQQETLSGRFLGRYRPWQVMNSSQYTAFLKICQTTGRNPKDQVCSSKGAIGQMQFLPKTWLAEGKDGNNDGVADPWCLQDAIITAGQFLAKHGYAADPDQAIAYYGGGRNRGSEVRRYVAEVKAKAAKHGHKKEQH